MMDEDHPPSTVEAAPSASPSIHRQSGQEHQDDNNDTSMADTTQAGQEGEQQEDVLYYVDADGNRIDPEDMHDYSVHQEQVAVEEEQQAGQSSIMASEMEVDDSLVQHNDGAIQSEAGESSSLQTREGHDQPANTDATNKEEELYETEEDRIRYERPYVPPASSNGHGSSVNTPEESNGSNQAPNYAARWTITGHRKNVSCIQFSPNGEYLITAGEFSPILTNCWSRLDAEAHKLLATIYA